MQGSLFCKITETRNNSLYPAKPRIMAAGLDHAPLQKDQKYSSHFNMILIIGYKIRLLCLLPKARLRCFMLPFAWTDCGTMLLSLEILSLSDCGTFINRKGQLLTYMTRLALLISYVLAEVLELEEEPHPKSTADH